MIQLLDLSQQRFQDFTAIELLNENETADKRLDNGIPDHLKQSPLIETAEEEKEMESPGNIRCVFKPAAGINYVQLLSASSSSAVHSLSQQTPTTQPNVQTHQLTFN